MTWALPDRFETSSGTVAAGVAGSGPAVILAHGWPWSSFAWHRVIPSLADHYRVHWYDMPGYGRSSMLDGWETALDAQAHVFQEMLTHWQLERPLVVAHDVGGAITLRAHLLHGCDYTSHVLMNVVALSPWGSAFFDHVRQHGDAFRGVPPHIHEAIVRAYIGGALAGEIAKDDIEALVAPWLGDAGKSSFYRQFEVADEHYTDEIAPLLGRMRCPVHVAWGEDDPWIPAARGRQLAERLGNVPFHLLEGAGHLPQLEAPDRVVRNILTFLKTSSEAE